MHARLDGAARRSRAISKALMLSVAMGCASLGAAATSVPAQAQDRAVAFDIPAGPLSTALNRLAQQAGLQIGFDSALVADLTTPGLSGTHTPDAALELILAGTGLRHSFTGADTVTLAEAADDFDTSVLADEEAILLDVISIQGEKVTRDYFRTYTSVGIVTGDAVREYKIEDLQQAMNRMANVRAETNSSGNANFVIRGLNAEGVTQPSRSTPIISVIVDGATTAEEGARRGSRGVWDVEQIEVLRGPQSTLQGRSALGGAVIVETKDPTWVPEFIAEAETGSDDYLSGAFAFSAPIVEDQVAIRIAGQAYEKTNGIDYSTEELEELGEEEFQEIRGKLLVTPDALPGFAALFTVSHTHDKPAWNAVTKDADDPEEAFFDRHYVDDNTTAEFRDTRVTRYIADLSQDIGADWKVRSVTALTTTDVTIEAPDSSIYIRDEVRDENELSQDLRFIYEPEDGRLSGVFGLFGGVSKTDIDSGLSIEGAALQLPLDLVYQTLIAESAITSYAAYADLRYDIGTRWTLLGGGRLLHDEISADYSGSVADENILTGASPLPTPVLVCLGTVFEPAALQECLNGTELYGDLAEDSSVANAEFLPKLGIAFDLTPDQTVALTATKGYRPGFKELIPFTSTISAVEPEYLWSYEIAYRSRWLEDRLQFNANAFYYDYTNQQIPIFAADGGAQTYTVNAAESHAYGAEFEIRYRPFASLQLFSSLGLLQARFDEGVLVSGGSEVDLDGQEIPEAPSVTASLGGIWRHDSGIFVSADVSYTDGYYSKGDYENDEIQKVDPYAIVNAQIGYEHEHATLSVFATNLFDEQYLTSKSESGRFATVGEGRRYGIRGNVRF